MLALVIQSTELFLPGLTSLTFHSNHSQPFPSTRKKNTARHNSLMPGQNRKAILAKPIPVISEAMARGQSRRAFRPFRGKEGSRHSLTSGSNLGAQKVREGRRGALGCKRTWRKEKLVRKKVTK